MTAFSEHRVSHATATWEKCNPRLVGFVLDGELRCACACCVLARLARPLHDLLKIGVTPTWLLSSRLHLGWAAGSVVPRDQAISVATAAAMAARLPQATDFVSTAVKTCRTLLGDTYLVPPFQQPLTWRKEQVKAMVDEIEHRALTNAEFCFLGTITLTRDRSEGRLLVIDGQHRLTVFALMVVGYYHVKFFSVPWRAMMCDISRSGNQKAKNRVNGLQGIWKQMAMDAMEPGANLRVMHTHPGEQELLSSISLELGGTGLTEILESSSNSSLVQITRYIVNRFTALHNDAADDTRDHGVAWPEIEGADEEMQALLCTSLDKLMHFVQGSVIVSVNQVARYSDAMGIVKANRWEYTPLSDVAVLKATLTAATCLVGGPATAHKNVVFDTQVWNAKEDYVRQSAQQVCQCVAGAKKELRCNFTASFPQRRCVAAPFDEDMPWLQAFDELVYHLQAISMHMESADTNLVEYFCRAGHMPLPNHCGNYARAKSAFDPAFLGTTTDLPDWIFQHTESWVALMKGGVQAWNLIAAEDNQVSKDNSLKAAQGCQFALSIRNLWMVPHCEWRAVMLYLIHWLHLDLSKSAERAEGLAAFTRQLEALAIYLALDESYGQLRGGATVRHNVSQPDTAEKANRRRQRYAHVLEQVHGCAAQKLSLKTLHLLDNNEWDLLATYMHNDIYSVNNGRQIGLAISAMMDTQLHTDLDDTWEQVEVSSAGYRQTDESSAFYERIAPEKLASDAWPGWNAATILYWENKLGNMCPLVRRNESTPSIQTFAEKKAACEGSPFPSAQIVCAKTAWSPADCQARQEWFVAELDAYWAAGGKVKGHTSDAAADIPIAKPGARLLAKAPPTMKKTRASLYACWSWSTESAAAPKELSLAWHDDPKQQKCLACTTRVHKVSRKGSCGCFGWSPAWCHARACKNFSFSYVNEDDLKEQKLQQVQAHYARAKDYPNKVLDLEIPPSSPLAHLPEPIQCSHIHWIILSAWQVGNISAVQERGEIYAKLQAGSNPFGGKQPRSSCYKNLKLFAAEDNKEGMLLKETRNEGQGRAIKVFYELVDAGKRLVAGTSLGIVSPIMLAAAPQKADCHLGPRSWLPPEEINDGFRHVPFYGVIAATLLLRVLPCRSPSPPLAPSFWVIYTTCGEERDPHIIWCAEVRRGRVAISALFNTVGPHLLFCNGRWL